MIKKKIDNYLSRVVNRSLEKLHFQNGCSTLNLSRYNYKNVKKIIETDLKIYSQNGEDGIIDYLLFSLNIEKPKFIEIGVGDYSESNTRFFFERTSGDGLIIDIIDDFEKKVKENVKIWKGNLKILQQNIDANNILDTLKNNNFSQKIDLLSLDIDGIDYWILKELPKNFCKILVAEYNPYFGDKFKITVPNIKNFNRSSYHYSNLCFGASLPALIDLLKTKGMDFVGTNLFKNNAFFVNNDFVKMLNLEKINELDLKLYVNANFRESRNISGSMSYIDPKNVLNQIKDCKI
ncbi:hypothetical protein N8895_05400, partial [Candidatus Pelagibacter sp.]|nr:hypothetical protein [Candidatus Pelagibacter sp.]